MDTEKEKRAIQYLKSFEPESDPYHLCYSGGKDSDAIRILADLAGVRHEIHNNHTTVDAPETVRYIRSVPGVIVDMPPKTMWRLIVEHGIPPTRLARYCCAELKERGGRNRVKVTGVRWDESQNRKDNQGLVTVIGKSKSTQKAAEEHGADFTLTGRGGVVLNTDNSETRRFVESCYRTTTTLVNPIVDWLEADVWEFLHHYGCESNPLYQCGFKRIGCIGCPLGGYASQKREFKMWPKYRQLYVRAFDRMVDRRSERGLDDRGTWTDGEHVMRWWVGDDPRQIRFEDLEDL